VKGTCQLESTEGGTSKDPRRKQESKRHLQTIGCRERDKIEMSKYGKNVSKQEHSHPIECRDENRVRTVKESIQSKGHSLSDRHWGRDKSGHHMDSKQVSKGHLHPVKHRGSDKLQ
jgi:hypothetical protein